MNGFAEAGFAAGSVTGVRWWNLQAIGRRPPAAELAAVLHGARGPWMPGENVAECAGQRGIWPLENGPPHEVPEENCGCGFWGYWTQSATSPVGGAYQVLGVIEGYGTTLIGELGFRCAKARILALCLMFTVKMPDPAWRRPDAQETSLWTPEHLFSRGGQGMDTYRALGGRDIYRPVDARPPMVEDVAALTRIEAGLEDRYQVPVYATPHYMLHKHPPTTDYLPAPEPDPRALSFTSFPAAGIAGRIGKLSAVWAKAELLVTRRGPDVGPAGSAQS